MGGLGDAHNGVGVAPYGSFDPVAVAPLASAGTRRASFRPLSAPTIRGWCFAAHALKFSPLVVVIHDPP